MLSEIRTGPVVGSDGAVNPARADKTGATMVSDAHGRFAEAVRRGSVYFLSLSAGAATAYTGGAAGTPLLSVFNPLGSGKNLELIGVAFGNRVVASAIGWTTLTLWGGVSANPTGTQTNPTNMLSLLAAGSVGRGFVNTVMTGSTALGLVMPLASLFWGTSVGVALAPAWYEIGGASIAIPGNQLAVGLTVAPASATYDATLIWEEVAA